MDMMDVNNMTNQGCMIFGGNEHKCNAILAARKTTASLSLIGCLFMVGIIWLFGKYTLFVHRLIFYLTIAAFMLSVAFLMQEDRDDGPLCKFEAFWVTLWLWAVLTWECCIIFYLLIALVKSKSTEKYEIIYHCIGWGLPLFVSLLPFIGDHYGPAGAWCWITDDSEGVTHWRFSIWYGPLIIIIILMFIANGYILWTLKRKTGIFHGEVDVQAERAERDRKLIDKEIKPLVAYPLIYVILYSFGFINRIQNAANPEHPVFALVLLHALTSPLVGVVNAIVYGLDQTTRKKLNKRDIKEAMRSKRSAKYSTGIQEYNPEGSNDNMENPGFVGDNTVSQNAAARNDDIATIT